MISGDSVMFGLGTVGVGVCGSALLLGELRLGRYKVGEETFKEDLDARKTAIRMDYEIRYGEARSLIDMLESMKLFSQSKRALNMFSDMSNKRFTWDFRRGDSIGALNVVIKNLDLLSANILMLRC